MSGIILLAVLISIVVIVAKQRDAASSPFSLRASSAPGGGVAVKRSPLQDKLDDWVAAELIDANQADALLAHEMEGVPAAASRVPLAAEAVGYIGSGLVLASAVLLVGNRWDDLSTPARLASLAVPTVVAALAGWWTGRSDEPALQRLGSVLWFLAVVGVAGLAVEVWVDAIYDGDPPQHHAVLFVGLIAFVAAAPAWWLRKMELQQLALLAATITTSMGILDTVAAARDRSLSPLAAGLVLLALGTAWVAVSLADRLPPALLANVSGSALILLGAQIVRADNEHAGLWLGLVAAIALMATGVARSTLEILFVGTAGLFQWTPQIALFYLEDTLGAEATLLVIGALLIGVAGLFTRIYPWVSARTSSGAGESHETPSTGEHHKDLRGVRGHRGLPLMIGGSVIALVLVALASQLFGSTEPDFREPALDDREAVSDDHSAPQDDRGPVQAEEWSIDLDTEGVGAITMIKTFNGLDETDIEDLGGRLVWKETEIELCNIGLRSIGEGFIQIGDIFMTADGCEGDAEMQQAFEEFGPPETACVYVRSRGVDDEYCAPLAVRRGG